MRNHHGIVIAALAILAAVGVEGGSPPSLPGGANSCPGDMARIPGGLFRMGVGDGQPEESPVHQVSLPSFCMDRYQVTAAEFGRFVKATAYKTTAERVGWSGVFRLHAGAWDKVTGADWRHPDGPGSTAKPGEPVTQISWEDAPPTPVGRTNVCPRKRNSNTPRAADWTAKNTPGATSCGPMERTERTCGKARSRPGTPPRTALPNARRWGLSSPTPTVSST